MSYQSVVNAFNYLNTADNMVLKKFVTEFNEDGGFSFSCDPKLYTIYDALERDGHSGSSFPLVLRACQSIFNGKSTLDNYKTDVDIE